jgi:hypothetical protein
VLRAARTARERAGGVGAAVSLTVWKFPFDVEDDFAIEMPAPAQPLSVQIQHGRTTLWALVDPSAKHVIRRYRILGTGHPSDGWPGRYIGTFKLLNGEFVGHLFELDGGGE